MNYCYVLYNEKRTHTYAGYTVNPSRRLRQHNRVICGGAQYTKNKPGPWYFLFLIKCNTWTKCQALSFEYYLKNHGKRTPGCPIERRCVLLKKALSHDKFIGLDFEIACCPEFTQRYSNLSKQFNFNFVPINLENIETTFETQPHSNEQDKS